uniref:Uncharacterized protein n=1 Tax=Arundo donax TaxID=35708 RepID=A0A0A9BL33_ARUDO
MAREAGFWERNFLRIPKLTLPLASSTEPYPLLLCSNSPSRHHSQLHLIHRHHSQAAARLSSPTTYHIQPQRLLRLIPAASAAAAAPHSG